MAFHFGCCYLLPESGNWQHLPQVALQVHATLLSTLSRTTVTQTFTNPAPKTIQEVSYRFPLYDGATVVEFKCRVGNRLLHSEVRTKQQADVDYQTAVGQGRAAGILDQFSQQTDVFLLRLGNVVPHATVTVDITFVRDLKSDAQTDGIRYTLPNAIAPRYGNAADEALSFQARPVERQGLDIVVDILMDKESVIREVRSPSHPINVTLGRISSTLEASSSFEPNNASASLRIVQENPLLNQDFVLVVKADETDIPRALLEMHPTMPDQRAVMATLVPKFSLPVAFPEVVFIVDRSGSMWGNITTLQSALRVFLKSLPVGVPFNICSFGSDYSFLWQRSRTFDAAALQEALVLVDSMAADMGGTEMTEAVKAVVRNRLDDQNLDVLVLTDGQISQQQTLFDFIRATAANHTARFFSLGLGHDASHSLVEGIARAGDGFAQSIFAAELDRTVVRMLKGALSPHIYDYALHVEYDANNEDEFEMVDRKPKVEMDHSPTTAPDDNQNTSSRTISLFDKSFQEPEGDIGGIDDSRNIPSVRPPAVIQAPHRLPTLYSFIRTTVYLLLESARIPKSLTMRATSNHGQLELRIPIEDVGLGKTIHQLAARKAIGELEEEHGWLVDATDCQDVPYGTWSSSAKSTIAIHECQRLGLKFQVPGRHCSFVALDDSLTSSPEGRECETPTEVVIQKLPISPSRLRGGGQVGCYSIDNLRGGSREGRYCASDIRGGYTPSSPERYVVPRRRKASHLCVTRSGSRGNDTSPSKLMEAAPRQVVDSPPSPRVTNLYKVQQWKTATKALEQPPTIHAIIYQQNYDGSWAWSPELISLLGLDTDAIRTQLEQLGTDAGDLITADFPRDDNATVLATLLVIGYMEHRAAESKSVWELVCQKAETWVSDKIAAMSSERAAIFQQQQERIKGLLANEQV
ncbi:hypothetical protein BO78DRAFT_393121 [Aspergillus sclerotiicarbonarius CBS 121057]|uniref:von Willebrand domain protein n=1 Tax=Aspergillus sclerotiicarbonarius (strain CBS 121057 / IBT 28362) TaxID=1448318 RepID=A0A319EN45_ASPSB|nr:hypothetical protein BO78DRAFT_393121 [Aspergillus sclerotiicarbonarius CBS 121057]